MANNNKIPQELLEKAMKCETPEELLRLAKENGVALTKDEAEAYLAEGGSVDLSEEEMSKAAGGGLFPCPSVCNGKSCSGYLR